MLNAVAAETVWRSESFCADRLPNDTNAMMTVKSAARVRMEELDVKMGVEFLFADYI